MLYQLTDQDQVEANQMGEFSDLQWTMLHNRLRRYQIRPLWLLFLLTASLTIVAIKVVSLHAPTAVLVRVIGFVFMLIGPLIGLLILWDLRGWYTLSRDLKQQNIVAAAGGVLWDSRRGDYVLRTLDGRRIRTLDDDQPLPPGHYQLYFLGRHNRLLSAEKQGDDLDVFLTALQDIFDFTPEDLQMNRSGYLSDRQKRKVWKDLAWAVINEAFLIAVSYGLLALLLIGFAAVILRWSVYSWLMLTLFFIVGMWALKLPKKISASPWMQDLAEGRVQSTSGIRKVLEQRRYTNPRSGRKTLRTIYYLEVISVGRSYRSNQRAFNALRLQKGLDYRVYYTPQAKVLLSAEPVRVNRKKAARK